MAGFIFKLRSVLMQRELVERGRRRELALHLKQRNDLYTALRGMQQTITDSKRQLGAGLIGMVDLREVGQFARFSGQTTAHAHAIVKRIAVAEKQALDARESLREATRARKVIEVLRDRQYRQWKRERERREQAQLDEVAAQQYLRRVSAGGER